MDTFLVVYMSALQCSECVCQGSVLVHTSLSKSTSGPTARPKAEVLKQAKEFLEQYYTSTKKVNSSAHEKRWQEVVEEVEKRGTYELTATELVYGAKTGWRNAQRCIGRIQWAKLQVFDARYVTTTGGMFEAVCNHIKYATNKGNIRSAITIFPQRTDGLHDYRVWNQQLIGYAGYKQPDGTVIGDPLSVEFTEVCLKLGWKGNGGRWDVLPLVVSAGGHDPEYYEYPDDLILQVPIQHPQFEWFSELDLRWYAVPAVSSMLFDVGGIEFPAVPFNGWYMVTEIGCRDLCDVKRYNVLEQVAERMGLDITTSSTLWKDRTLVEVNLAVLYSFQSKNVTILDHHTASESFMKHMENENKLRGGCPADWVWIVPPMSGSITPVFHQEMLMYHLKPSYEYQEPAWKTHIWKKNKEKMKGDRRKSARKFRFREIARAVKFTSKLFGKALSRRIKATILYATETGKSEGYATLLGELFNHSFNAQVMCMSDYDVMNLEHETLVLVVASTFGNGDPPENGEEFVKHLYAMKSNGLSEKEKTRSKSKAYKKLSSSNELKRSQSRDSADHLSLGDFGPLGNVRFGLFALGSSAYPNFCAFGRYVDSLIEELGGERLLDLECGDELCGQEQTFKHWARKAFQIACDVFCVGDNNLNVVTEAFQTETQWTGEKVRLTQIADEEVEDETGENDDEELEIANELSKLHSRQITTAKMLAVDDLHSPTDDRQTVLVKLDRKSKMNELCFYPGDHLGVCPTNRKDLVDGIVSRMTWNTVSPDQLIQVSVLKEQHTISGLVKSWVPHDRLPKCTVRTALSRYLDVTSPPAPQLLKIFASLAQDEEDKNNLIRLASDTHEYEKWKRNDYPTLLDVLDVFSSIVVEPSLLLTQLPTLQPRFYSISSSPRCHVNEIHLTVAVVKFTTQYGDGDGAIRYGVCSNYLANAKINTIVPCFIRSAQSFRLPDDPLAPVIMVGPGTGVAPFRSFWQERYCRLAPLDNKERGTWGKMSLYFGCRKPSMNIFEEETRLMVKEGIISEVFTAFSREPNSCRYVQDLLTENASVVFREIYQEKGHFYVCGDVSMAEDVGKTLGIILQSSGRLKVEQAEAYLINMRDENRYHEDIFGATHRAAEVRNRQRKSSWNKLEHL
ncbi:hypothetical protein CHUAL_005852 [Chamberlinius hualienensis]